MLILSLGTPPMVCQSLPQLPVGKLTCLYGDYGLLVSDVQVHTIQASVTLVTSAFPWVLTNSSLWIPPLPSSLVFRGILPLNFLVVLVTFAFGAPVERNPLVTYLGLLGVSARTFAHPSAFYSLRVTLFGLLFSRLLRAILLDSLPHSLGYLLMSPQKVPPNQRVLA